MTYTPAWTSLATTSPGADVPSALQYVNSATMALSQWDVSISFRLQHAVADSTGANVGIASDEVVQVVMSPTHAKVLAHLLERTITEWEQKFGDLPSVDQLVPAGTSASVLSQEPSATPAQDHSAEEDSRGPEVPNA